MIMRVKSNNYALYNAVTYNPSSITFQGYNNYINNGEKTGGGKGGEEWIRKFTA